MRDGIAGGSQTGSRGVAKLRGAPGKRTELACVCSERLHVRAQSHRTRPRGARPELYRRSDEHILAIEPIELALGDLPVVVRVEGAHLLHRLEHATDG